jgi:hypothetical protein
MSPGKPQKTAASRLELFTPAVRTGASVGHMAKFQKCCGPFTLDNEIILKYQWTEQLPNFLADMTKIRISAARSGAASVFQHVYPQESWIDCRKPRISAAFGGDALMRKPGWRITEPVHDGPDR